MKSMIACLLVLAVATQAECYGYGQGSGYYGEYGLYPNPGGGLKIDPETGKVTFVPESTNVYFGSPAASSGVRPKRQVFGDQTIPFNFQMPYAFIPGGYIPLPPSSYIAPYVPAPGYSLTSPTPGQ